MERHAEVSNRWRELGDDEKEPYLEAERQAQAEFEKQAEGYEQRLEEYEESILQLSSAARSTLAVEMTSVGSAILEMVQELRNHPEIVVTTAKIRDGLSEETIERAQGQMEHAIPADVAEFYRQCGGLELEWHSHSNDEIRGTVNILPLLGAGEEEGARGVELGVCSDWRGSIFFDDCEGGHRFRHVRPVDAFTPEACAALYPANPPRTDPPPTMHYHYCGDGLWPMHVGFAEYVALLLKSRGFWYWQKSLNFATLPQPEAQGFLEQIVGLFPDVDRALFLPRSRDRADPTAESDGVGWTMFG